MIFWTIVATLAAGLIGIAIYIFYLQKGQFEDSEDVKYQLFREND